MRQRQLEDSAIGFAMRSGAKNAFSGAKNWFCDGFRCGWEVKLAAVVSPARPTQWLVGSVEASAGGLKRFEMLSGGGNR